MSLIRRLRRQIKMTEINNLTAEEIDLKFFQKIAVKVLNQEKKRKLDLSVAFINYSEIKRLNKKYRKKNKATDVLSFLYDDSGEIVVCPQEVRKNVKIFKSYFKKELARVLIHGILHLLGYDHEKNRIRAEEMEKRQERYLKKFF